MKMRISMMCATAAWLAAGTCAWAQNWTGTKLNGLAKTNETGAVIVLGTEGSYNNIADRTKESVFDGLTTTFFDPPAAIATMGACWAGIELTLPKLVTRIRYFGRGDNTARMRGCLFQGADNPEFANAVTLHTANPPAGWLGTNVWVDVTLSATNSFQAFRYLRLIGPNPLVAGGSQEGTYAGNAAEVEFYGVDLPTTDAPPPPPALAFANAANWRANLRWTIVSDAMGYEVQRMLTNETEFTTVLMDNFLNAGTRTWIDPKYLYGDAAYRIRAINGIGDSGWVNIPVQTRNAASGAWFGTVGSYNNTGATGDKLFDGDITTFFDGPATAGNPDFWSALDLGESRQITSLRYMPRDGWQSRMPSGRFEAAHDTNFTDAVTLYTIPNDPFPSYNTFTEVPVSDSTFYRYVRYVSPYSGMGNALEIEFIIPPCAPRAPVGLTAVSSDLTNDYPVLSWDFSKSLVSSSIVHRATAPGGPYSAITPEGVSGTTWTDTTADLGVFYYYKVSALYIAGAAIHEGPLSAYAAFRRCERIERTWEDNTQLKAGMTGFLHERPYTAGLHGITNIFDGRLDTFTDAYPARSIVGVDLGAAYHVSKMRFAPRADQVARLNGAVLCGSNNGIAETNVLATFSGAVANTYTWGTVASGNAYRYIFVTRTDADFYGNLTELELYGWPDSAVADVLTAPASVTFTPQTAALQINWTAGDNAASYRVERATAAAPDTWVTVDTTAALSLADAAPIMHTPCLYRVVALRGAEEAVSDPFPFIPYAPDDGTGLKGYYTSGFTKAYDPSEALRLTRVDPGIDFTWTGGPIIPGVPESAVNVLVIWNGTLAVPITGSYIFRATTDDGIALRINGTFVINEWNNTGTRSSAPILLEAGRQHDIRMDYYQGAGNAYARLEWDGPVTRGIIPAAQFTPVDLPSEDIGLWRGRTFNAPRLGTHATDPATGGIRISSGGMDFNGANEGNHFVWQTASGSFLLEATVEQFSEGQTSAKAMLVMRNALASGSPLLAAARMTSTPSASYGTKGRLTPGATITDLLAPPWISGPEVTNPCRLRLKRLGNVVTMGILNENADWVNYYTYTDTNAVFNSDVFVGLAVTSPNTGAGGVLPSALFTDIRLVPLSGTMLIVQ